MNVTDMPTVYNQNEITIHAVVTVGIEVMVLHNAIGLSKPDVQNIRVQQTLIVETWEILLNVHVLR